MQAVCLSLKQCLYGSESTVNFDVVTDIFVQQLVSENTALLETIINTAKYC